MTADTKPRAQTPRRPTVTDANEWLLWLEDHKGSAPEFIAVQIVEAIEEHQKSLARQVYALAEATQDECHGKDDAYYRGRAHEAKGIARTIHAIMPLSRDPAPTLEQRREIAEAWTDMYLSFMPTTKQYERIKAALRAAGLLGDEHDQR